jgi:hypothetical protein
MFAGLVDWIVRSDHHGNAGSGSGSGESSAPFVHESVAFEESTRRLTTTAPLAAGTLVLRIPVLCSSLLHPQTSTSTTTTTTTDSGNAHYVDYLAHVFSSGGPSLTSLWHHDIGDLQLAWEVALKPWYWQPYLASLPATLDLPRMHYYSCRDEHLCEDEEDSGTEPNVVASQRLRQSLAGSSVVPRLEQAAAGIVADYQILTAAHGTYYSQRSTRDSGTLEPTKARPPKQKPIPVPSLADFSYAMAVVTSRAFHVSMSRHAHGPNHVSATPVLVPILDLCDHCRGRSSAETELAKNLSYTMEPLDDDSNMGVSSGFAMCVTAATCIAASETLRVTYGALSNSALMVNYGFCLPHNAEPDGSSNDIVEFYPTSTQDVLDPSEVILLRTGPKSYTYSSFVTALQSFTKSHPAPHSEQGIDSAMEDFLDECDEEEEMQDSEDDSDSVDLYSTSGAPYRDAMAAHHSSSVPDGATERNALEQFRRRLLEVAGGYSYSHRNASANVIPSTTNCDTNSDMLEGYAALLIHSELRTLQFFLVAVHRVMECLLFSQATDAYNGTQLPSIVCLSQEENALMDSQVNELVQAYMQIRHRQLIATVHEG